MQRTCLETRQRAKAGKHNRKRLKNIYTQVLKRPRRPQTLWYNDVRPNLLHDPFGPGQNTGSPASTDGVGGATSSLNSRASDVPGASAASTKLHHLLLDLLIVLCHDVNRVRDRQGGPRVAQKARGTPDRPLASCRGSGALPTTLPKPHDPNSHLWARQMQNLSLKVRKKTLGE